MIVSLSSWLIIERKESILRSVVVYLCTKISGEEVIIIAKPWKEAKINIWTIKIYHNLCAPWKMFNYRSRKYSLNRKITENLFYLRQFKHIEWVVRPAGLSIGIRSRREPKQLRGTEEKISFTGAARTLFNALYYREPIYELLICKQQLGERWFIVRSNREKFSLRRFLIP